MHMYCSILCYISLWNPLDSMANLPQVPLTPSGVGVLAEYLGNGCSLGGRIPRYAGSFWCADCGLGEGHVIHV